MAPRRADHLRRQLGRPSPSVVEKLVAEDPTVQAGLTGTGERDSFGPDGILANEHFDTLTSIIDDNEAEQARVCATVPNCRTDEGARAAYVDHLENLSSDWNHLNVRGQAAAAEITWPPLPRCWSCDHPRSDDAVLSTYEYRGNPVVYADPGS